MPALIYGPEKLLELRFFHAKGKCCLAFVEVSFSDDVNNTFSLITRIGDCIKNVLNFNNLLNFNSDEGILLVNSVRKLICARCVCVNYWRKSQLSLITAWFNQEQSSSRTKTFNFIKMVQKRTNKVHYLQIFFRTKPTHNKEIQRAYTWHQFGKYKEFYD